MRHVLPVAYPAEKLEIQRTENLCQMGMQLHMPFILRFARWLEAPDRNVKASWYPLNSKCSECRKTARIFSASAEIEFSTE
jgi:hypothetical protein